MNEVTTTRFLLIEDPTVIGEEKDDDTKWWLDTARPLKNPEYPDYPFIVVQTEADKDANNFVRHAKMKLLFTDQAEYYAVCLDCYFAHSDQQWSGSTNQPGWRDRSARYLEKHITNKGWCQFCDPVFGNGGWYRG
jgi:hypothetical protein